MSGAHRDERNTVEHWRIISLISPCISVYPLCNSV